MAKKRKEAAKLDLNLTSMMDVSFQLIIFFILISNFAAADLPDLKPPDPTDSIAQEMVEENRVLINIVPDGLSGEADHLVIFGRKIARNDYPQVINLLRAEKAKAKAKGEDVKVYIRADGILYFEHVQPIMKAATEAGISKVSLVALRDSK